MKTHYWNRNASRFRLAVCLVVFITLIFETQGYAKEKCIPAADADMKESLPLKTSENSYNVKICYLPEVVKDGVHDGYYHDLIMLMKNGRPIIKQATKMSTTVGRISELVFEKSTGRFIAISYDAGEFCNGIVIFDKMNKSVALSHACVSDTVICHVATISDSTCQATMECQNNGGDGPQSTSPVPTQETVNLCSR